MAGENMQPQTGIVLTVGVVDIVCPSDELRAISILLCSAQSQPTKYGNFGVLLCTRMEFVFPAAWGGGGGEEDRQLYGIGQSLLRGLL